MLLSLCAFENFYYTIQDEEFADRWRGGALRQTEKWDRARGGNSTRTIKQFIV